MALDGIVLNKIVEKLNEDLPIRINKIYSIGKNEILFNVRAQRENKKILISNNPNHNRIQLTSRNYDNDQEPSNFVMLLRKYLLNGNIVKINQFNFDRIIEIQIENHNNIGDLVTYNLHLELLGRYSNTILCDSDNIIIDAIKRISPFESETKSIIPGAKYQNIVDYEKTSLYDAKTIDINANLSQVYSGLSPALAEEIKYRISKQEDLIDIIGEIKNSDQLVISKKGVKSDYHLIPLTNLYEDFTAMDIFDGLDHYHYDKSLNQRIKQETDDLLKFIRREIKKSKKKIEKISNEIHVNTDYEDFRLKGDLLTTYLYSFKKGDKEVTVIDYNDNQEMTIQLDTKLAQIDNAQKYYKQYRKRKNSLNHLNEQIEIANNNIAYFTLLKDQLEFADIASAKEIKEELIANKYLFDKKKTKKASQRKSKPNYLSVFYNDISIKVGRNNIQNDYLLKQAHRNDYWFHVADYHGSHVLVSASELSDDIIEFAATLAAQYSQISTAENVTVNYTQVRNIKKTKIKGLVNLSQFDSITIPNDKNLIKDYIK
ncbi:MAG: fibronectin/fibrinogen-binding protein [Erysipelothrix sp.]|nr:fibronectin/fibrinogen-binding protein [Erysipelothrix sp.]